MCKISGLQVRMADLRLAGEGLAEATTAGQDGSRVVCLMATSTCSYHFKGSTGRSCHLCETDNRNNNYNRNPDSKARSQPLRCPHSNLVEAAVISNRFFISARRATLL